VSRSVIDESAVSLAEQRCRAARSIEALAFTISNETHQVVPYRQAQVWRAGLAAPDLLAVSGLALLPEDSPFTVWLRRLVAALWPRLEHEPLLIDLAAIDAAEAATSAALLAPDMVAGWQEWWPAHLVAIPLAIDGKLLGAVLLCLDTAPDVAELAILARLQATWSYCAWALTRASGRGFGLRRPTGRNRWGWFAVIAAFLLLPVRQTALAPAEIVALKAMAIAAPIEGVIKVFHVHPNQKVKAGQLLFSLDDTTLRNRREVSARALEVAAAELLSAQQKAFDDNKARGDVATLQSRIAERRAELRAVEEQLGRIDVSAPRDGIAVFGDINDWQGRPVAIGERVMQVADPKDTGVLVYLPVADAIATDEGERMRVFLHVAPLSPLESRLSETSYQAVLSPDGIASYRIRGTLDASEAEGIARIGLKGTAKVYGSYVALIYYVMRRPLAALRQVSGL